MDKDRNVVFADLAVGVPPDVYRLYEIGQFAAADRRIEALLQDSRLPRPAAGALTALREMMRRLPQSYTLTRADALALLRREIPDFSEEEFDALLAADRVDWRCLNGTPYYLDRFAEALRLYPDMNARGLRAEPGHAEVRDRMIRRMRQQGSASARITVRASVAPAVAADPGAELRAWLPIPAACELQSDIEILDAPPHTELAPEDAPQRTAYWQGQASKAPFTVTYRYTIRAPYHDMEHLTPDPVQPTFYTHEEAPHLLFTPWLRALCAEVTEGCDGPVEKARAIYDYVTLHTRYRYQPAYVCLENISEGCAKSGWGDCGVMALLFIVLCRIAGIPARWQSGLYVTPDHAGCHDWAQFYIAPYGWLWADCSFGAGAHRTGDEARRRHYFGNLDPLRMVANRGFYTQLTPPDEEWRNDPYDNQVGEAVLKGMPLHGQALSHSCEVLRFEEQPDEKA
ncbi:MAG: transglutaminase-like domain-containing protein [Gemmiger sp.]|uniref:transglutaminase-like domain-containing protein n=1 Tax=Gemmiger sp. TaxID=2049027 RepID=UPI002E765F32|nr:transglutaminase-like domain-containing protein [Gemmiger sp.]MEE0801195.1 transglutaminase-like domain-containing protein [Gemmiger sp.]